MDIAQKHNVSVSGNPAGAPMLFAHGFGCDQNMWRFVTPAFQDRFRVVTYDLAGYGGSKAWDPDRHARIEGYADDVLEICRGLELPGTVFVGHSVASMIGALASIQEPGVFDRLVMIGPSPRYIDDDGYVGGFSREDIEGLLESLDSNYLGWSAQMAPVIMGNPDRPELGAELTESFCRTDPEVAKAFARVTFLSDNREDLREVSVPTLVLQCSEDAIAPEVVGDYVHERISGSTLVRMRATGHCPNLSAPEETIEAIRAFVEG